MVAIYVKVEVDGSADVWCVEVIERISQHDGLVPLSDVPGKWPCKSIEHDLRVEFE